MAGEEQADLSQKYLSNIETGRAKASIETLVKICHTLDITPNEILLGTSKENVTDFVQTIHMKTITVGKSFELFMITLSQCGRDILKNTDEIYFKSELLRQKVMQLDNIDLWNVEFIKSDPKWLEIIDLSDEIKALVNKKWTKEKIDYLFKF